MHVKYANGLTRIVIICGFFWLGIMITLPLSDELTRSWEMNPSVAEDARSSRSFLTSSNLFIGSSFACGLHLASGAQLA